jgi:alpha-glucosidase (family GH31 glycosyl hydrolase)
VGISRCRNQYYFGSVLVAAPFVSLCDPDTRLARQAIWPPAGDWLDFFGGEYFPAGRWHYVFPDADNRFELYKDDSETFDI